MSTDFRPIGYLDADSPETAHLTEVLEEGSDVNLPPSRSLNDNEPYWVGTEGHVGRISSSGPTRVMRLKDASVLVAEGSICVMTKDKLVVRKLSDTNTDSGCGPSLMNRGIPAPEAHLSGTTLVPTGRYWRDNYWHFTTGIYALLLLAKRRNLFETDSINRILIPHFTREVFGQMLRLCNLPPPERLELVFMAEGGHVTCENLVAVGNNTGEEQCIPEWKRNLVRTVFMRHRATVPVSPLKKIIVVRRNAGRGFKDQEMVMRISSDMGYHPVDLEGMTFLEQAALFYGATHIIAVHGSALTNLFYAQEGARVMEVFNPFYVVDYFTTIAEWNAVRHYTLVGNGPKPNTRIFTRSNDPIVLGEAAFSSAIERFEHV